MAVDTQTTTETDSGTRTPIVNEIIDVDNYIYLNAQTTDESDSNTIASFIENDIINIDSRESSVARIPARHVSETTIPPRAPLPISLSLSATPETPIAFNPPSTASARTKSERESRNQTPSLPMGIGCDLCYRQRH